MLKHLSFAIGALAFSGASLLMGASVQAATMDRTATCCRWTYDHAYNDKGNTYVIESLTERINAMELAIIEALRLGTGQVSGNLKEQIGADSNLANAQDDRAVVGRIEEARLDALRESASGVSACNVITGSLNATAVEAASLSYAESMAQGLTDWGSGAANMPSSQGTAAAISSRVALHCERFANQQDVDSGLCESVGSMPDASINAAKSLFYHEQGSVAGTLDKERLAAVDAYVTNLMNPEPTGAALQADASTAAGREAAAGKLSELARFSAGETALADITGRRSIQESGNYSQYLKDTAAVIPGYKASDFGSGVSWYDMMDVRARAWFMNTNWAIEMNAGDPAQAVKDSALIESFNSYLGWETYKLLQRQTVILATMLAIQVEETREP